MSQDNSDFDSDSSVSEKEEKKETCSECCRNCGRAKKNKIPKTSKSQLKASATYYKKNRETIRAKQKEKYEMMKKAAKAVNGG